MELVEFTIKKVDSTLQVQNGWVQNRFDGCQLLWRESQRFDMRFYDVLGRWRGLRLRLRLRTRFATECATRIIWHWRATTGTRAIFMTVIRSTIAIVIVPITRSRTLSIATMTSTIVITFIQTIRMTWVTWMMWSLMINGFGIRTFSRHNVFGFWLFGLGWCFQSVYIP